MPRAMTRPIALNGLMLLNVFISGFRQDKDDTVNEISQTEKDKSCMILLVCGVFKKGKKPLETVEKWLPVRRGRRSKKLVKGHQLAVGRRIV